MVVHLVHSMQDGDYLSCPATRPHRSGFPMSRHRRLRPVSRLASVASVLVAMLSTLATALAAPVTLARTAPARTAPARTAPVTLARTAPRRYAREVPARPTRIPNYAAFAEFAEQHSALWEITFEYGHACPYTARHRVTGDRVAASSLALLDLALAAYI